MSEPTPTILPTRGTEVASAVLAGGLLGYLLFAGLVQFGYSLPVLSPIAWLSIMVCVVGIGVLAYRTHQTVQKRRDPIEHKQAITRLLLGKTSLLAGAFLGSAYLGLLVVAVQGWPAPLAQERVLHGGLAALACAGWALAGWLLERACRIPTDDDTPPATREGDGSSEGREVT